AHTPGGAKRASKIFSSAHSPKQSVSKSGKRQRSILTRLLETICGARMPPRSTMTTASSTPAFSPSSRPAKTKTSLP
ncbi:hypothetical protein LTR28_003161, partial [Elasticomyces elasticus]